MADRERPPSFELSSERVRYVCISMLQVVVLGAKMSAYEASNNGGHFSKLLPLKKAPTFQLTTQILGVLLVIFSHGVRT